MQELTEQEIAKFASRKDVKRIAVYNFLSTLGNAGSEFGELTNMRMDAQSYKWNAATQKAISDGIRLAYGR